MNARFDHASGSVVFTRAPLYGRAGLSLLQPQMRSAGGDRFALDPALTEKALPLSWKGMPKTDADALENFFRNVVGGMAEPFTYTSAAGIQRTVRFATPEIEIEERAFERFDVTLHLMEA